MSQPIIQLPLQILPSTDIGLLEYQRETLVTDKMPKESFEMPFLGLFGEVGSLLSELKKKLRDSDAYSKYDAAILEELGDVLWYFTTIASRARLDLSILAQRMSRQIGDWDEVERHEFGTFGDLETLRITPATSQEFAMSLIELAGRSGDLMNDFRAGKFSDNRDLLSAHLVEIFRALVASADAAGVRLGQAACLNIKKTLSRWPKVEKYPSPINETMHENERLPSRFSIYFEEVNINDKTYVIQKRNGVIIGDRLTDNKTQKDDYRFHDVFHIAYAVFLGWSPVLRALFRLKRKSNPDLDENEDGARAILIEEGVSTFVFERGLSQQLFIGLSHVDYDLLKAIQQFVQGYEVQHCFLWQWEKAILSGFRVFRELKTHRRGYVHADLVAHTLEFTIGQTQNGA